MCKYCQGGCIGTYIVKLQIVYYLFFVKYLLKHFTFCRESHTLARNRLCKKKKPKKNIFPSEKDKRFDYNMIHVPDTTVSTKSKNTFVMINLTAEYVVIKADGWDVLPYNTLRHVATILPFRLIIQHGKLLKDLNNFKFNNLKLTENNTFISDHQQSQVDIVSTGKIEHI